MRKIKVRRHTRKLKSGRIIHVRKHFRNSSYRDYIKTNDSLLTDIEQLPEYTDEEIDQMEQEAQLRADIDKLSGKTIVYINEKNKKTGGTIQQTPSYRELDYLGQTRRKSKLTTKKQASDFKPIHWSEY